MTLEQILVLVSIIAVLLLCAVLLRLYQIMTNVKKTSDIMEKRVSELDRAIDKLEAKAETLVEMVKGFFYSMDFIKKIKSSVNKKGETDEE
ncbi:MAG: hypothetical protein WC107_03890 [Patescibacteria group bacterium]